LHIEARSLCDGGCELKPLCYGKGTGDQASGRYVRANSGSNMLAKIDDNALFSSLRDKLFTAVVGDVLDKLGWRRQFLPQAIGPLRPDMKIVGRAMPVLEADVFDEGSGSPGPLGGKPFGLMLEALDDLRPNEVYVATGGSFRYALWGELMSTRAGYLRAAGAVLNGFVRDAAGIEALGFPTFCRGVYAQDQGPRGKVIDFPHSCRNRRGPHRARRPELPDRSPCRQDRGRPRIAENTPSFLRVCPRSDPPLAATSYPRIALDRADSPWRGSPVRHAPKSSASDCLASLPQINVQRAAIY
jgi:Aldolase/RraA